MFGIGPGIVGGPASTAPAATPLTILGSCLQWCRADLGVTIATGVSAWADQSGNGRDYSQGVGSAQPSHSSADATLNNQASITFDGTADFLDSSLTLPAPATTNTFIWAVFKQNAWTAARNIFSDGTATRMLVFQQTASPGITMASTTQVNNNTAGTLSSWWRGEWLFTGSTSDYGKIGATTVGGASANNSAGGGTRRIATNNTASTFCSLSLAEIVYYAGTPSGSQLSQLDTYCNNRYGSGLV